MKKTRKPPRKPNREPMFTRYLEGPELEQVTGGLVVNQKPANSCTHDGDYDY